MLLTFIGMTPCVAVLYACNTGPFGGYCRQHCFILLVTICACTAFYLNCLSPFILLTLFGGCSWFGVHSQYGVGFNWFIFCQIIVKLMSSKNTQSPRTSPHLLQQDFLPLPSQPRTSHTWHLNILWYHLQSKIFFSINIYFYFYFSLKLVCTGYCIETRSCLKR